jgi:hypothetical protein
LAVSAVFISVSVQVRRGPVPNLRHITRSVRVS